MPEKVIDVPGFGPTSFPDSMSDDDIVAAIQKQHPDLAQKPAAPQPPRSMASDILTMAKNDPMVNVVAGFAKDVGSTGYNLLKMAQRNNAGPGRPLPIVPLPEEKPAILEPEGTPQKIGAGLSTLAQFAAPSVAAGRIPAVAKAGLMVRSGAEAALAGGVSRLRGDQASTAFKNALLTGGITGLIGTAGKILGPLGERIELSLLKPVKSDLADVKGPPELAPQTLIKNLYKYDLGGTLAQSYTKAQALTKKLGTELRTILGSNPKAEVDMLNVLADTAQELKAGQAGTFGTNSQIAKAVDNLLTEIQTVAPSGKVNLADAQDIKQALGFMGAWQNGLRDAESTATETVANSMYSKLKTAIEQASGHSDDIKAINQKFSEVIPIKNALIRRIPVAARRDPISLKEFLGLASGNIGGVMLAGSDRLLRSGSIANAAVKTGANTTPFAARMAPIVPAAADRLRSRANPNP